MVAAQVKRIAKEFPSMLTLYRNQSKPVTRLMQQTETGRDNASIIQFESAPCVLYF